MAGLPVVIDTDIGSDPDDALALLLALASPELDLRGVTVVSGDVALRGRIAARLLGMAGRPDIPVILGDSGPYGEQPMDGREGIGFLDQPYGGPVAPILDVAASEWLVHQAEEQPFHLVGIGPLSNVAAFLRHVPEPRSGLLGVSIMGGLLDLRSQPAVWQQDVARHGATAWPDHNTVSDPEAAYSVATADVPITWVPLDVTVRAALRTRHLAQISRDTPLGAALAHSIDSWRANQFATLFASAAGPSPIPHDAVALLHDPLTVASLLGGDWLRLRPTRLSASLTTEGFRLRADTAGLTATLADSVDGDAFATFCLDRITRLLLID